jgi:hypothetical protein
MFADRFEHQDTIRPAMMWKLGIVLPQFRADHGRERCNALLAWKLSRAQ